MNGVRKIERLDPEGTLFVSLTEEVDLDDLFLELLVRGEGYPFADYDGVDFPSALYIPAWSTGELDVGRYRTIPCFCGEGHAVDVVSVADEDMKRGSFLGVMTR